MNPGSGYLPVESSPPLRGLATAYPANKLDGGFSPALLNVTIRDGIVRRRPGGVQLGRRLVGRVLAITEFGEFGEDPYTLALTTHRQYAYDPAVQDWVDLTPGQVSHTIIAVDTGTDSFTVAGDQTAGFTVGRLVPVIGGANEGVYTVQSSTFGGVNTVIVVVEEVPSAVVAGVLTLADDLVTDPLGWIDYAGVTDVNSHRFIMTNGTDLPRIWTGDILVMFVDWAPTFTGFESCKTLTVFVEHLFLGGVVISAVDEPNTIVWSKAGDFDDFETGDSGSQILYQMDAIKSMRVLGDRLAVYSNDIIITGIYIGLPAVFAFEVVIPEGTRLASSKAVTSVNVGHIYVSEENFYIFDGSRGLRVLSDPIWNDYKQNKNHELLYETCILNDYSKRTLFFAIPDLAGESLIYTARYDVFDFSNIIWAKEKYADTVTCWGFFVNRDESLDWEDASWEAVDTTWNEELGLWAEEGEQLNFPMRSYGTSDGYVVIVSEGAMSDRGTTPSQQYETKDFEVPEIGLSALGRWGEIEFEASGDQVNVQISIDGGGTWRGVSTVTLTAGFKWYSLPIDYMSRTARVRFITSGSNYLLRHIRLWVKPGGPQ